MTFVITDDRPPILTVTEACRRAECEARYVLPYDEPLSSLWSLMYFAGWTTHPYLGPVCPQHSYGMPVAALPAAPLDRPTAPFQAVPDRPEEADDGKA
jgi:hypothetical protein